MNEPKSYRESHAGKGDDYHLMFSESPHTAMLWELEKKVLNRILVSLFGSRKLRHLDFACGTGRVLAHIGPHASEATGVDVAASMLAVAKCNAPHARLIEADITRDNRLRGEKYELITAFRFFPNAEPALRQDALHAMVKLLTDDGVVIFNNHQNASSTLRRIGRIFGKFRGNSMSDSEVRALIADAGLQIIMRRGLGYLPINDTHMLRPTWLAYGIELLCSKLLNVPWLAQNIVYVCRQ
jgi:predicted TPR repeat methyltransferase